MAVTDRQGYYNVTAGSSTSANTTWQMPLSISSGSYVYAGGGGAGGSYSMPAPRPQTALEWLDAEIEATCKLARLAG